ncbi:MAG: diguanylate cyclase [Spirochaetales bacterium]|nr:diguanylate cyclase [Spirochaetales bacterium]
MDNINLLIVDDEEEYLDLMSEILKKEGYTILTVKSGPEALELLKKTSIQIVLIDILMPTMLGFTVCQKIRKIYNTRPIQIILVSGLIDDLYLEEALEVGGDDFIHKPIVPIELQRRMKAAVIRLRSQMKIYSEREILKETVAEKDNQHKTLKKEFETIKKKNTELITSNKELKNKVRYDILSGLLNRMSLFDTIDSEIERAIRSSTPLTGIMMDIDHFKRVNDRYGHQVGDVVIQHIGEMLQSTKRSYDHAGRYGGEEFFMVLTNSTLKQGISIAERFRKILEKTTIKYSDREIKVTVSMGIAQYRIGESRDAWIERADKAMYMAKKMGRNRTISEEMVPGESKLPR